MKMYIEILSLAVLDNLLFIDPQNFLLLTWVDLFQDNNKIVCKNWSIKKYFG